MDTVYLKDLYLPEAPRVKDRRNGFWEKMFLYSEADSSLDRAWELFREGRMQVWDSVLCEQQTRGRGRMRRRWSSPRGNIYAAWLWPTPAPEWRNLLSFMSAYILCMVLREMGFGVLVKWPNDLWSDKGKVGGILVEEKENTFMVGVGINVFAPPDKGELRGDGLRDSDGLGDGPGGVSIPALWARLVYWSRRWYDLNLQTATIEEFLREYEAIMAWLGQTVRLSSEGRIVTGEIRGINCKGEILLKKGESISAISSGSFLPFP